MYENIMKPAFAGMKADLGDDRVESWVTAYPVKPGQVVTTDEKGKELIENGSISIGIAVHDHLTPKDGYKPGDTVGVMVQGAIWALADADNKPDFTAQGAMHTDGVISKTGKAVSDLNFGCTSVREVVEIAPGEALALVVIA